MKSWERPTAIGSQSYEWSFIRLWISQATKESNFMTFNPKRKHKMAEFS